MSVEHEPGSEPKKAKPDTGVGQLDTGHGTDDGPVPEEVDYRGK